MNEIAGKQSNVITLQPSRLPMSQAIANEYNITAPQWRVLVDQIFPSARSIEPVLMALEYCRARNLDIFKKPVHIVPMWDTKKRDYVETVWPGISEIRTTAHRTGQYAGCDEIEEGPTVETTFNGEAKDAKGNWNKASVTVRHPEWVKCTVYRITHGVRASYTAKVRWLEAYATAGRGELPTTMWQKRPFGQAAKCAEAASLRMAFPEELGSMYSAEEMEGQSLIGHNGGPDIGSGNKIPVPAPPPPPPDEADDAAEDAEIIPDEPAAVETPEELLARAETWLENCKDGDDLDAAKMEFEPLAEGLGEDDRATLDAMIEATRERIDGPITLGAG